jgi:hypothetical protein
MTLTEITVTRCHCMEARGEDGSGEAPLRGANLLPSLGQLIQIRYSECVNLGRRAHLRVIRGVGPPSGCTQGLALRVASVAAMRGGGEFWLAELAQAIPGHGTSEEP